MTVGRQQVQRAVWPVRVVVPLVDAEYVLEVAAAEDQDAVETVTASGVAHPVSAPHGRPERRSQTSDIPKASGAVGFAP